MGEAIDHCIRWREEGATGTFKVTTRRKEVEEIILCENASLSHGDESARCDWNQASQIADAMEGYHLTLREKTLYDEGDEEGAANCRRQVWKILFA